MIKECPNDGTELRLGSNLETVYVYCPICDFKQFKNKLKLKEMFAFVSVDPKDDNEGIITAQIGNQPMPLVGGDIDRMNSLKPLAKNLEKKHGIKVKLLHFTNREELDF